MPPPLHIYFSTPRKCCIRQSKPIYFRFIIAPPNTSSLSLFSCSSFRFLALLSSSAVSLAECFPFASFRGFRRWNSFLSIRTAYITIIGVSDLEES